MVWPRLGVEVDLTRGVQWHLQVVTTQVCEYWAGSGNLTAAHVEIGLRCRSLDKLNATYHDCTTNLGLRYWIFELCCTACRSLCWLGIQRSSFVKICVSQSQRRAANDFVGDETK